MEKYLSFTAGYYIFILLFFTILQRPLFMIYNRRSAQGPISGANMFRIVRYGFLTDIIVASYFTAIPLLAATSQAFIPYDFLSVFMTVYNITIGLVLGLMVVADTALYTFWHYKIDASVLAYLRSLKGAFASVTTGYIITGLVAWATVSALLILWMQLICRLTIGSGPYIASDVWHICGTIMLAIVLIGLCFILIRGLHRRPNNPSLAFFSKNLYYNHAALNPIYSFIYSLSVNDKIEGAFHEFPDEQAHSEFAAMFPDKQEAPARRLLRTNRPNVLFIVWESLGARFVESLGGASDVTPNLDRLAREGIMFTHVDAGSFRTDRALVCLLSGYLAQPTTSVIRMTKKLPNLPALPRVFKDAGYETTVLHGGDLTIFHKSDYYLTIGHDTIVSEDNFPKNSPRGKWGIHDGILFDWLYDDIMDKTKHNARWYTTFQTLSSHETFEVPYNRLPNDIVANSFAYVDDALGRFVDRLKQTPAWNDLLIVVVGDHGCNMIDQIPYDKYTHIPVVMLGGAVKEPQRIDTIMSQTDIAATLLAQLDLPHDNFIFSRDVMSDTYAYPFSFHAFNNGFMFRDATGFTVYDNVSGRATSNPDDAREHKGKIILQNLYEDLA
ncbi:MAG: LTA synthase family protein, partial [Muribaculaceae bacterium]|nr:LTA synthase family protein [Muribaculaceae bacterium]